MFDDLRKLFRESVAAFRTEIGRREPEDEVAELLSAMRRELVAARAALPEYTAARDQARAELARERTLLEQTERRGALAERIGDAETVRVAAEFADGHRARVEVLEHRVAAAEAECELRTREAEAMKRRFQEADANRMLLLAELRRGASRERLRGVEQGAGSAFADWERMAERIDTDAGYADALRDLDDAPPPRNTADPAVDERLRELKRRMGKE